MQTKIVELSEFVPAASHIVTLEDERERPSEGGNTANGERAARRVAAHGFITAPEILTLLFQLDVDAVLDGLEGASAREHAQRDSTRVRAARGRYDRRAARRVEPSELAADFRLTIPGTSDVVLVNVSETGALVETSSHASLDTMADLIIRVNGRRYVLRARTVRSSLFAIRPESGAVYRTALQFEQRLSIEDCLRA